LGIVWHCGNQLDNIESESRNVFKAFIRTDQRPVRFEQCPEEKNRPGELIDACEFKIEEHLCFVFLLVACLAGVGNAATIDLAFRCEPNGDVTFFAALSANSTLSVPTGSLTINGEPNPFPFTDKVSELPVDFDDRRSPNISEDNVKFWQTVVVSGLEPNFYFIRTLSTPSQVALQGFTYVADIDCGGDVTPPTVQCSVELDSLAPANKKLVNVGLGAEVADDSGESPTVEVYVFSNQEEGVGKDGILQPDATDIGLGTLKLRAERGRGEGRVYLIVVLATDAAGNVGCDCCTVVVPHNKGKKEPKGKKKKKPKGKDGPSDVEILADLVELYWLEFAEPPPEFFAIGDDL
jgi:hypothetical protein